MAGHLDVADLADDMVDMLIAPRMGFPTLCSLFIAVLMVMRTGWTEVSGQSWHHCASKRCKLPQCHPGR
jgi:hypothetical protein